MSSHSVIWPQEVGKLNALGVITLVPVAIGSFILVVVIYRVWLSPLARIPGPRLLAASDIINQWHSNVTGTFPREVAKLHRQYGPIVRVGPNRSAVDGSIGYPQVFGIRAAKGMTGESFKKVLNYVSPFDDLTILGCNNDDHRRLRRQLAHAFSEAALREQEGVIVHQMGLLLEQLTRRAQSGETVDVVTWMNYTFFDIIGDLTFAKSFKSLESGETHPYIRNFFGGVIGSGYARFLMVYPYLSYPFALILGGKELQTAMKLSGENSKMGYELSQSRMQMGAEPADGRRDFMTYMLRKTRDGEQGMSTTEIMNNSSVLVGAGSETTASAMSFFFYTSGLNPEKKKILQDEIRSAFSDESSISLTACGQLEYLQAFIEETLRMFPPTAETPPRVSPGAELDGKFIPSGTVIHVYPWATFRNPDNFVDPDSFRPERWLSPSHPRFDERYANDNRACFKPFSYGPRDCIGKNLAYSEMRLLISRILYRFDYNLLPGQERWHDSQNSFLIWNKSPLKVQFSLRQS
ncbi:cytochrome P450 [Colletotrichum cereale]|nr:cytochrome P450 [Colletotrichum cereale]